MAGRISPLLLIFHPRKVCFPGGVNLLSGSWYLLPFVTVTGSILPLPPFALKLTTAPRPSTASPFASSLMIYSSMSLRKLSVLPFSFSPEVSTTAPSSGFFSVVTQISALLPSVPVTFMILPLFKYTLFSA